MIGAISRSSSCLQPFSAAGSTRSAQLEATNFFSPHQLKIASSTPGAHCMSPSHGENRDSSPLGSAI
jgi:hypothetical protein